MKKGKFTGLILSFCLLCMGILTGCSLVETDYDRYYNQVVAVVESKEDSSKRAEITKMDLISGYQSYGYTYEQYYGYSRNEAIRATLDLLENRLVTIMTAEEAMALGFLTKKKHIFGSKWEVRLAQTLTLIMRISLAQVAKMKKATKLHLKGMTRLPSL